MEGGPGIPEPTVPFPVGTQIRGKGKTGQTPAYQPSANLPSVSEMETEVKLPKRTRGEEEGAIRPEAVATVGQTKKPKTREPRGGAPISPPPRPAPAKREVEESELLRNIEIGELAVRSLTNQYTIALRELEQLQERINEQQRRIRDLETSYNYANDTLTRERLERAENILQSNLQAVAEAEERVRDLEDELNNALERQNEFLRELDSLATQVSNRFFGSYISNASTFVGRVVDELARQRFYFLSLIGLYSGQNNPTLTQTDGRNYGQFTQEVLDFSNYYLQNRYIIELQREAGLTNKLIQDLQPYLEYDDDGGQAAQKYSDLLTQLLNIQTKNIQELQTIITLGSLSPSPEYNLSWDFMRTADSTQGPINPNSPSQVSDYAIGLVQERYKQVPSDIPNVLRATAIARIVRDLWIPIKQFLVDTTSPEGARGMIAALMGDPNYQLGENASKDAILRTALWAYVNGWARLNANWFANLAQALSISGVQIQGNIYSYLCSLLRNQGFQSPKYRKENLSLGDCVSGNFNLNDPTTTINALQGWFSVLLPPWNTMDSEQLVKDFPKTFATE